MSSPILILVFLACNTQLCPDDMVFLTGGKIQLGVSSPSESWHLTGRLFPLEHFCIDPYEYPNQKNVLPMNDVSFLEAQSLCEKKGKRLCTEAEWVRACRGVAGREYSYGNTYIPDKCNTAPEGEAVPFSVSGDYKACQSPEGVFDLNGNLSEWVNSPWPRTSTKTIGWMTLRGGTIDSQTHYGQDCTSRHGHDSKSWTNKDDGFRCCQDVRSK
jgi:eukaryotic-like serine/threonine-protein kinase